MLNYNTTLISPLQQLDASSSPQLANNSSNLLSSEPPSSPSLVAHDPVQEDSVDCPTYLKEEKESLDLTACDENISLQERKLKQKTVKF